MKPPQTAPRMQKFALILIVLLCGLTGCSSAPKPRVYRPKPSHMPTYTRVVRHYNHNVARLHRLWSKATVKVRYRDHKGKIKKEQGDDSTLLIQLPDHLALVLGKFGLGRPLLWAGSDTTRFWLFDLVGEKSVVFGSHQLLRNYRVSNLPLKISPKAIPQLMGLLPIPLLEKADMPANIPNPSRNRRSAKAAASLNSTFGQVGWHQGRYVISPPGQFTRIEIDPSTWLPQKISLLDAVGRPVVQASLSHPKVMAIAGVPQTDYPRINTHIQIEIPHEHFRLTLTLRQMSNGRAPDKARAFRRAFNLPFLMNHAFKIPRDKQIDLDQKARDLH